MSRPRQRIPLEDGLRLDLTTFARRGLLRAGPFVTGSIRLRTPRWERRPSRGHVAGDEPVAGFFVFVLDEDAGRGSLSLRLGALEQTIELVTRKRDFGGRQWCFLCPVTERRACTLWLPSGASRFASRLAWGRRVAYRSQFMTADRRATARAQAIRRRLGGRARHPALRRAAGEAVVHAPQTLRGAPRAARRLRKEGRGVLRAPVIIQPPPTRFARSVSIGRRRHPYAPLHETAGGVSSSGISKRVEKRTKDAGDFCMAGGPSSPAMGGAIFAVFEDDTSCTKVTKTTRACRSSMVTLQREACSGISKSSGSEAQLL
jgi:hypothetical protein